MIQVHLVSPLIAPPCVFVLDCRGYLVSEICFRACFSISVFFVLFGQHKRFPDGAMSVLLSG